MRKNSYFQFAEFIVNKMEEATTTIPMSIKINLITSMARDLEHYNIEEAIHRNKDTGNITTYNINNLNLNM